MRRKTISFQFLRTFSWIGRGGRSWDGCDRIFFCLSMVSSWIRSRTDSESVSSPTAQKIVIKEDESVELNDEDEMKNRFKRQCEPKIQKKLNFMLFNFCASVNEQMDERTTKHDKITNSYSTRDDCSVFSRLSQLLFLWRTIFNDTNYRPYNGTT